MIEIIELHMIYERLSAIFKYIQSTIYMQLFWYLAFTTIKKEMINGGLQKDWFRKNEVNQEEKGKGFFCFLGIHCQYKKNEIQRTVEIGRVR